MNKEQVIVSIVILSKNGGALFKELIEIIFQQKVDFLYEVIVIDSGSSDSTLEFLKHYPLSVIQIDSKDFSFGKTRDFGFSQARGEYIVTLSQDVVPVNEYWLQKIVTPLINDKADVIQGRNMIPQERRVFFWSKNGLFYFTREGDEFMRTHGGAGVSCTNLAMKKQVWEDTTFGPVSMSEDKFLQKIIYAKGYRLLFQREATTYHGHSYNLRTLIKRCENEGFGWKVIGIKYSFIQMIKDLKPRKLIYSELARGILKGEIKTLSELLFPVLRPIFIFKGNLLSTNYRN
jgi:rhamnosyltransferase